MALLTREAIQQKTALEIVEVDVTELGNIINPETGEREQTSVFVREMSAREKSKWQATFAKQKGQKVKLDTKDMWIMLVLATCCDADGTLIFRSEDMEHLANLPTRIFDRILDATQKLNGFVAEEEEELVKN